MEFDTSKTEYVTQNFKSLALPGTELFNKEFDACTFDECDFSSANITGSKFIDCQFIKCNLSLVKLNNSRFNDVLFDNCKMIGIDWTQVSWPEIKLNSSISFYQCNINDSTFFGLSLERLIIDECKSHDVDFREGDFTESSFIGSDFLASLFSKTNLRSVDFTNAVNYKIDPFDNDIKEAKFSRFDAVNLLEPLGIVLVD